MTRAVPDPVHALAADVERLARRVAGDAARVDELAGLVGQLAADVATLVAQLAPDGKEAVRSWLLADDPQVATRDLRDLTEWLAKVYLRYPDAVLPACWLWHPALVEELRWLRSCHRRAYDPKRGTWLAVADWHDRLRPGVARRLSDAYSGCELREHAPGGTQHRPAPAVALAEVSDLIARQWATNPDTPLIPTDQHIDQAEQHDQSLHSHDHYPQAS